MNFPKNKKKISKAFPSESRLTDALELFKMKLRLHLGFYELLQKLKFF
jgi:hypothetical protein